MSLELGDQRKRAGRNSRDKDEEETTSGGKDRQSQGQVMKEGRDNMRLDREALNLIHDRSRPS